MYSIRGGLTVSTSTGTGGTGLCTSAVPKADGVGCGGLCSGHIKPYDLSTLVGRINYSVELEVRETKKALYCAAKPKASRKPLVFMNQKNKEVTGLVTL